MCRLGADERYAEWRQPEEADMRPWGPAEDAMLQVPADGQSLNLRVSRDDSICELQYTFRHGK